MTYTSPRYTNWTAGELSDRLDGRTDLTRYFNGAKTLGWESQIGSIEAQKSADLIAIEIDSIHHQPLYNPASQLVYSSKSSPVTHSWVAGQPLLKASNLSTLDEQKLIQSAKDWGKKLIN